MARRPPGGQFTVEPNDPLQDAVNADRENVADALLAVLDQLGSVDQGTIKGILYRIPIPNGKYEWIRDVYPPFDMSEIMVSLKEDIGGGDYALRLMAEGKVRKTLHFSIMKDRTPLVSEKKSDSSEIMPLMLQMMQGSADRQMQMMMQMNQQSQAMFAQMNQSQQQMMATLIPAMMGGREKTSEMLQAFAAMQPRDTGGGLKETLELLTVSKGLFSPGEEKPGLDMDDLVGSGLKLAGPVIGALGKAFSARGGAAINPAHIVPEAQDYTEGPAPLMLPHGDATQFPPHPVLDLIRDDVLYTFSRNHDPERAAELVFDTLDAAQVSEDQINELVAAFAVSPDWLTELAGYGIDLRSRPEWASAFLAALVAIHSNAIEPDDSERGSGDAADVANNGAAGAGGLTQT
jgi:hypothetical protein